MPQAAGNVAVAPLAARGCLALLCAGAVWLFNAWLFSAAVAALVIARAACRADDECPVALAAASVAVTALVIGALSSVAMHLLSRCVLDPGARAQMAAATREALDGGAAAVVLGKVAAALFVSIVLVALFAKVYPPLKGWDRVSSAALDAVALCASALCCFFIIPTFAIRMWKRS